MSTSVRGTEASVPVRLYLIFIRKIESDKQPLGKSFPFFDDHILIAVICHRNDDMTFVICFIIVRIDDPYRIQQNHLVFETERRTRIDL